MSCYPEKIKGRTTGRWIAEATLPGVGRVRKRCTTFAEGERWADRIKLTGELPSAPGDPLEPAVITFGEAARLCKEAGGPEGAWKRGRDPEVISRLEFMVTQIGADTPLVDVNTALLRKVARGLAARPGRSGGKLTPATVNRYLSTVSCVLQFALGEELIDRAPKVPRGKEEGHRFYWLTDEAETLVCSHMLTEGHHGDALAVRVLTATGMRWSEFAGLEQEQIELESEDPDMGWVRLWKTKTDTPRSVPIPRPLARSLRALVGANGMPKYSTFVKRLKRALKSSGQNPAISVHTLRHTTASRLAQRNVSVQKVQQYLGHKNITTTMRYTHLSDESLLTSARKLTPTSGQSGASVADTPTLPVPGEQAEVTETTQ